MSHKYKVLLGRDVVVRRPILANVTAKHGLR
jgi:hypothetical protein